MKNSICIVVVFNHRYDKNIEKIRKIYSGRFSRVLFLVPFYDQNDTDVIPVYESSYQFQGYFIQAYEKLVKIPCQYYLFIADDMVLNPAYNEDNILPCLGMENREAGMDYIVPLNREGGFSWHHARYSSRPFLHKAAEWKDSLLVYEKALSLFEEFWNDKYPETYGEDFYAPMPGESMESFQKAKKKFLEQNQGERIPYPMARGYSDILCVKRDIMHTLFHKMGIFSAMNLFAEIAIPTAIVLSVPREKVSCFCDLPDGVRKIMWDKNEILEFKKMCGANYKKLEQVWNCSWRYAHPVKLSAWEV